MSESSKSAARNSDDDAVVPFLIGTLVGGLAAAVVALIIGEQRNRAVTGMIDSVDRRVSHRAKNEPQFDLLLQ